MTIETIAIIILLAIGFIVFLPVLFIFSWSPLIIIICLLLYFVLDLSFIKSIISAIGIFIIIDYLKKGG